MLGNWLRFQQRFSIFISLVCDKDFNVSFEAFTVIQEMESEIDSSILKQALDSLLKIKDPSVAVTETIHFIEQKLNTN